ncbi:DUF6636 domain-containing protein [Ruegeria halocynthiae]|uniref:DUF6636 domain-containing protein n=1 Tax=Ruegeria halocynthiae TaxID=985054 RepID=UPI000567A670|nr:DUF6636 domain-containing protein [Ruegeria halocynthiae]
MPRFFVLLCLSIVFASGSQADVWTFETPSENIQCSVGQGAGVSDIFCTIIERRGTPALPRPADCQSDWGHDFLMLNTGPVQMQCGPLNRNRDGYDRAEYGVTGKFGGFVCHSSKKGLECKNEDGHGFFLSRAVQRVF